MEAGRCVERLFKIGTLIEYNYLRNETARDLHPISHFLFLLDRNANSNRYF